MSYEELKKRIANILEDPYSGYEDEEYTEINLEEARGYLAETLEIQDDCDLDEDERIPEDTTPEVFMQIWNEIAAEHNAKIRKDAVIERLAEWITDECCVAEYDSFIVGYYREHKVFLPEVCPMIWIDRDIDPFELNAIPVLEMVQIVRNSPRFNPDHEFYTFTGNKLISTNNPFEDGIADAKLMATFLVEHDEDYGNDQFRDILDGKEIE